MFAVVHTCAGVEWNGGSGNDSSGTFVSQVVSNDAVSAQEELRCDTSERNLLT